MAQQKIFELIDDLTGKPADETVEFSLDGQVYEIDLSEDNAQKLRNALAKYIKAARKRDLRYRTLGAGYQEVRRWARERGIPVSDRGRVAFEIMEAYKKARDESMPAARSKSKAAVSTAQSKASNMRKKLVGAGK